MAFSITNVPPVVSCILVSCSLCNNTFFLKHNRTQGRVEAARCTELMLLQSTEDLLEKPFCT